MMERKMNFRLSTRLLMVLCLMGAGMIAASLMIELLPDMHMLAMLSLQDILVFMAPAIAAMAIFYHRPLNVMCLDRAPRWKDLLLIAVMCVISLPAMNWLVDVNESMTLPSWMSGIEQWMRASEDNAADITKQLLDIHSIAQLITCLLVVGFMAGLSEEILFRGAMLRTMQDSRLGTHAAVWLVAVIFSAIHLEFYGFVPRMLLGAWLGYLLVWTRSLWVPIIAHTLNNSIVVVFSYLEKNGVVPEHYGDHLGIPAQGAFPWLAMLSLIMSIVIVVCAHRRYYCKSSLH